MTQSDIVTIGVVGFVLITLIMGLYAWLVDRNSKRFIEAVNKVLDDKRVKDETERRYLQSSLTTQDFVHMVQSVVSVISSINLPVIDEAVDNLDEFLEDVTDGVENAVEEVINQHTADTEEILPVKE